MSLFLVIWPERQHFFGSFNFLCCCHAFLCDYNCPWDKVVRRESERERETKDFFFIVFTPQASFKIPLSRKTDFLLEFCLYVMPMCSSMSEILHRGRQGEKKENYVGILLYSSTCKHPLSWSSGQEYRVSPRGLAAWIHCIIL